MHKKHNYNTFKSIFHSIPDSFSFLFLHITSHISHLFSHAITLIALLQTRDSAFSSIIRKATKIHTLTDNDDATYYPSNKQLTQTINFVHF